MSFTSRAPEKCLILEYFPLKFVHFYLKYGRLVCGKLCTINKIKHTYVLRYNMVLKMQENVWITLQHAQ